jgi:hypothetical protein
LQDALSKQDTERVEMHLANFQKDIAVFEGKYNKFDAFIKDTNNFGENKGILGGRQHGVKINALPVSAKSADEAAFAIPWIGSQVSNGSKIIGYRSYGDSGSYGVQGTIYYKILEQMKQMEKRYGALAGLEGYEADAERSRKCETIY